MIFARQRFFGAVLVLAIAATGIRTLGQTSAAPPVALSPGQPALESPSTSAGTESLSPGPLAPSAEALFDFRDSDIKFPLKSLMDVLRDRTHEGWVLAAYPDPKTGRPLIGAGFSLDVAATEHPQTDPLNPHPFLEPSSAQLWQAAGLDFTRLQKILDQFDQDLKRWNKRNYRRKIRANALAPEVTEAEATDLLRVSTIQAVHNAMAYCRNFDQLTASQQMALSQLVFQMGVNLEEFTQFRSVINGGEASQELPQLGGNDGSGPAYWRIVQSSLIQSQWARRYTARAVSVIAMFDPEYAQNPRVAELRVETVLHPARRNRHHGSSAVSLRVRGNKRTSRSQRKRKLT